MSQGKIVTITPHLIAPCGIDCALCRGHVRAKSPCPGCRGEDALKPTYCVSCTMKVCPERDGKGADFCFACAKFPCKRLKQLDKRYRTKYGASPIANLSRIQQTSVESFAAAETAKWTCPECGALLCMHQPACLSCGYPWLASWTIEEAGD
jgi:hypothetical protein